MLLLRPTESDRPPSPSRSKALTTRPTSTSFPIQTSSHHQVCNPPHSVRLIMGCAGWFCVCKPSPGPVHQRRYPTTARPTWRTRTGSSSTTPTNASRAWQLGAPSRPTWNPARDEPQPPASPRKPRRVVPPVWGTESADRWHFSPHGAPPFIQITNPGTRFFFFLVLCFLPQEPPRSSLQVFFFFFT